MCVLAQLIGTSWNEYYATDEEVSVRHRWRDEARVSRHCRAGFVLS
jgi:hypothetical protein